MGRCEVDHKSRASLSISSAAAEKMAPPQLPMASPTTAIKIDDPLDWEAFKQRVRRGIDRCMSRSGEHLKDEVGFILPLSSKGTASDRNPGFQNPSCYCWGYSWVDS